MSGYPPIEKLNIRVYGLLVNNDHILLSHEYLRNYAFSKFPGGGLKLGETPQNCLIREFQEEIGLAIHPGHLFFTPDFFVRNYFRQEEQVIVLHYWVNIINSKDLNEMALGTKNIESLDETNAISHEWVAIKDLSSSHLTFPADQAAAAAIKKGFENE